MMIFRCIKVLCLIPFAWIDAFLVRSKPFDIRYEHIQRWCKRIMKAFKIELEVIQNTSLPTDKTILFISNHQSMFDLLMLEAGISVPFTFVSKVENKKIPILNSWAKSLELLYFDRNDQSSAIHMLRESVRRLKSNQNLLIFPEGTRSLGSQMHEMQGGSIQPAYMAKTCIVPVVLVNSFEYRKLLKKGGKLTMVIGDAVNNEDYKADKANVYITILQKYMESNLK